MQALIKEQINCSHLANSDQEGSVDKFTIHKAYYYRVELRTICTKNKSSPWQEGSVDHVTIKEAYYYRVELRTTKNKFSLWKEEGIGVNTRPTEPMLQPLSHVTCLSFLCSTKTLRIMSTCTSYRVYRPVWSKFWPDLFMHYSLLHVL